MEVIQSPNDQREYKVIELSNKVVALLISDPQCDKSAAAMNVHIGCLEDPQDRQGLAHFLEHMLFQGTGKYPQVDEYMAYLSKNSGLYNAYTDLMETNYFLECSNAAYDEAVDRFSQFFIDSLFEKSSVEKELNAVNSEHEMNKQSDLWRWYQIHRHESTKGSAFNKFGTGNLKTLQHESIREDLLEFYNTYYSANLMKLVLYSNQEMGKLVELAEKSFSAIPNKNVERPKYSQIPFDEEQLSTFMHYLPVNDYDELEFLWILDDTSKHYKNNPVLYIASLLGHEGRNSLLSLLKDEGLALKIETQEWHMMGRFSFFMSNIELTKKGFQEYQRVINFVFAYIKMLREKGVQEWYFQELKTTNTLKFQTLDKLKGINYVLSLGSAMQKYPIQDILRAEYLLEEYKPDLIREYINQLAPKNLRIMLQSKQVQTLCNKIEPIYQSSYSIEPLSPEILEMFNNPRKEQTRLVLDLPPQNIFIARDLSLKTADLDKLPQYPEEILSNDFNRIFFKQDNLYRTPKGCIHLRIHFSDTSCLTNVKTQMKGLFWNKLFEESINEMSYLAQEAYIEKTIEFKKSHLELRTSGFDDSLTRFVLEFVKSLANFDLQSLKGIFSDIKQQKLKELNNFGLQTPYVQAYTLLFTILQTPGDFDINDQIEALEQLQFEDILEFDKQLLRSVKLEWLIIGNYLKEQAIQIAEQAQKTLSSSKYGSLGSGLIQSNKVRCINLPTQKNVIWERDLVSADINGVLIKHYQYDYNSIQNKILIDMAKNLIHEPIFSDLRTQQQLGYVVFAISTDLSGVVQLFVLVQSDKKVPHYVAQRVDEFMKKRMEIWEKMDDSTFLQLRNSVKVSIAERDTSLKQEAARYDLEIEKSRFLFNRQKLLLEKIDSITKQDLITFLKNLIFDHHKCIEVHLVPKCLKDGQKALLQERLDSESNLVFAESFYLAQQFPIYPNYEASL